MRDPVRWLGLISLAASLLAGCATSKPDPELEQDRRRAESRRQIGMDHLANDRPELALQELLLSDRLVPMQPLTQFGLARAYLHKERFEEAEKRLLLALEIHPDFHDARLDLSTLYIQQGRWEESLAQTRILIEDPTFPAPWRALNNHGWAQLSLGRVGEARITLEKARDHGPRYWPALLNLGILEQQAGHHLEALELYRRILELEAGPNAEAEANYRAAEIYVSLGKRQRAMGHLTAAVAGSPDGRWGRKSEEYLRLLR